ncbi:glycerol dehydratase reactivase beta/small subunit family protein [Alkalibacterium psychrotolerans]
MSLVETQRPEIIISLQKIVDDETLSEILFGIEEEGIPYSIIRNENTPAVEAAHDAALKSKLSVGIGCSDREVVVHQKNLKLENFFFKISDYQSKSPELKRTLGCNAARLVKGNIFKVEKELEVSF